MIWVKNIRCSALHNISSTSVHYEFKATNCAVLCVAHHKWQWLCLLQTQPGWLTFTSMFPASQFDVQSEEVQLMCVSDSCNPLPSCPEESASQYKLDKMFWQSHTKPEWKTTSLHSCPVSNSGYFVWTELPYELRSADSCMFILSCAPLTITLLLNKWYKLTAIQNVS